MLQARVFRRCAGHVVEYAIPAPGRARGSMTVTAIGRETRSWSAESSNTALAPPPQMTSLIGCPALCIGEYAAMLKKGTDGGLQSR
jgi:hypothetical protein